MTKYLRSAAVLIVGLKAVSCDVPAPIALACNEVALVQATIAVANGTKTIANAGLPWTDVMSCLNQMKVDRNLGEQHHRLLPMLTDTIFASIFPRHNIWWDAPPNPGGRVMARIVSDGVYPRLGLDASSQNYVIVFGLPSATPSMIVVNAEGATPIGASEHGPTFIPHGPIQGGPSRPGIDPPQSLAHESPSTLSPAALKCFQNGLKACFIDSAEQQTEGGQGGLAGFGIGMPVVPPGAGLTVPWVACVRYGCCCGGNSCHS